MSIPAPPADRRDGIGQALADALGIDVLDVVLADDTITLPEGADEVRAREVVAGHVPAPPPTDPDDDLSARIQAVHDDPQVSASVKKLAAALLGLNGEAAVAGRPTDAGR